jgi:hypothetical protein
MICITCCRMEGSEAMICITCGHTQAIPGIIRFT